MLAFQNLVLSRHSRYAVTVVGSRFGDDRRDHVLDAPAEVNAQDPKTLPPVSVDAGPPRSPPLPNPGSNEGPAPATPGGDPQRAGDDKGHQRCADATAGNDTSFGCFKGRLKRKVDEVNPVLNIPPIDAKSSDLKVGTVNIPAVQQQYGKNFGHSVVPYRPPMFYSTPVGRH